MIVFLYVTARWNQSVISAIHAQQTVVVLPGSGRYRAIIHYWNCKCPEER